MHATGYLLGRIFVGSRRRRRYWRSGREHLPLPLR